MSIQSLQGGVSSGDFIQSQYKALLKGVSSNISFEPSTATTYSIEGFNYYKNFTVGANATLQPSLTGDYPTIIVCDTLTLNGIINAGKTTNQTNSTANNEGGGGGRGLIIVAKTIIGTGKLISNGGNAENTASTVGTNTGANGTHAHLIIPDRHQALATISTPAQTNSVVNFELPFSHLGWLFSVFSLNTVYSASDGKTFNVVPNSGYFKVHGGKGATGSSDNGSSAGYGTGGSGGACGGFGGAGGTGSTASADTGTGGAGGGAGGIIFILSESNVPSLTIEAKGGNGSSGSGASGGGGAGGGGGLAIIHAPSHSITTTNFSGGTGASAGTGGAGTSAGANGGAGYLKHYEFKL